MPGAKDRWEDLLELRFDSDELTWRKTMALTHRSLQLGRDRCLTVIAGVNGLFDVLAAARGAENLLLDVVERQD